MPGGWRPVAARAAAGIRRTALVLAVVLAGCALGEEEELQVEEQVEELEEEGPTTGEEGEEEAADDEAAEEPEAQVAAIGGDFVGMSQDALQSCAGAPDERFGTGQPAGLEQWVYHSEPPDQASSGSYCKATFSLNNGAVANAIFTGRDGTRIDDMSKCAAVTDPCL